MADQAVIVTGGIGLLKVLCFLLAVVVVTTLVMFKAQKNLLEDDDEEYDIEALEN